MNYPKRAIAPTHPGELLREDILPALGMSKVEFAKRLKLSRGALYNILNGTSEVTSDVAVRLAAILKPSPQFWLNMQSAYNIAQSQDRLADELRELEPIDA